MVSCVGKVCLDFHYHHCGYTCCTSDEGKECLNFNSHLALLEFTERCPMLGLVVVSLKIENTIIKVNDIRCRKVCLDFDYHYCKYYIHWNLLKGAPC